MPNSNKSQSGTSETITEKAKTVTADVATDLKSRAHDVAETVTSEAVDYADQAKETVADEVKSVATALRSAADEMRSGSAPERTFSQIADGLADASEAMRDKDLGQIVGTLNQFAKRNPLIFLGGAALVGFAATRFAKASTDTQPSSLSSKNPGGYSGRSHGSPGASASGGSDRGVQSPAINHGLKGGQR